MNRRYYMDHWKIMECQKAGIQLVHIPYWIHGDIQSVARILSKVIIPILHIFKSIFAQARSPILEPDLGRSFPSQRF
jgi:hypothetical protein